ncbi:hypothetical protein LP414_27245 [Polaromonas sp. P1(28)-13]|nr:hypothetical protein LP414_27245 [Polaromonas sp. P1(28)-13]
MNVRELKAMIADMPDEAPVLLDQGDHTHYEATLWGKTVLRDGAPNSPRYTEDVFTPETIGENTQYGERVHALCLV